MRIGTYLAVWLVVSIPATAQERDIAFVDLQSAGVIDLGRPANSLAVIDADGDGFLDLLISTPDAGRSLRLFRNVAGGEAGRTFHDATPGSGLEGVPGGIQGMAAADFDNDGDADLALATGGPVLLLRNDGGRFTDVTAEVGIVPPRASRAMAAAWCDADLDGRPDLFVSHRRGPARQLQLFLASEDGSFHDDPLRLDPVAPFDVIYAHLCSDVDGDGWPDLVVPADRGGDPFLLRNVDDGEGGRHFVDVAEAAGFRGLGPAPMGIAAGDFDGDLDLDLVVSDGAAGSFYENLGDGFQQIQPVISIFAWGVAWTDADNDGDLDLFMAGSWGSALPDRRDKLFRNRGDGLLEDASEALGSVPAGTQRAARLDFDNDGREDLVAAAPGDRVSVYHNVSTSPGHWWTLHVTGEGSMSRDAVGARVTVTACGVAQVRQKTLGSSSAASEDPRLHFGLGECDRIERLEVVWPRRGPLDARTTTFEGPFVVDRIARLTPIGLDPEPPAAPSRLRSKVLSRRQVKLLWRDNANRETGFEIERKVQGTRGFVPVATLDADVRRFRDRDLEPGTPYVYRIRAVNASGASEWSNRTRPTTKP